MTKKFKTLSLAMVGVITMGLAANNIYADTSVNTTSNLSENNVNDEVKHIQMYTRTLSDAEILAHEKESEANKEIDMYGLSKPSTAINLKSKDLKFSGSATGTTLYSNNLFTGTTQASYRIDNYSNQELTVRLYAKNGIVPVETLKVPARTARGGYFYLTKTKSYLLRFDASNSGVSNFDGYVRDGE